MKDDRKPRHSCSRALVLAAALVSAAAVQAQGEESPVPGYPVSVEAYDPREVRLLPGYCKHTLLFRDHVPGGSDAVQIERWSAVMGKVFNAMHHYCWGLMKTNRAVLLARSEQVRRFYLSNAIEEFDYVIRHSTEDFVLMPEILTKKGENLIRLGKGPIAVLHLEHATALKPDYWPPYAQLSDYFKSVGDVGKAEEYLNKGLSFSPEAAALKRRLNELRAPPARKDDAPRPVDSR